MSTYVAGSSTLALAGVMTSTKYPFFREYLFHHAEEEQDHWKWIIQNLRDTGYSGIDPRNTFPEFPTQAYLSFASNFSLRHPIESLAIAYVLEKISSELAVEYGTKAAQILNLNRDQMSFFILHGELDQGHETEIFEVLERCELTPEQWGLAEYAAKATAHFYKEMYNHAAKL
jgi:heme oxygenase